MNRQNATGTTYDAATPVTTARVPITSGSHSLYLSIIDQFDAVYDSAVLLDRIAATYRTDCTKGFEAPHLPTIFVPGILGTKMYEGSVEQWPRWKKLAFDQDDDHLDGIKLKADGVTNEVAGAHHGDIVLKVAVKDFYGGMVENLVDRGYVYDEDGSPSRGESLFLHGTDWRRSASWNAGELLDHVERVRAATGASKVNIIAHSQGGLVVRQMLSLAGSYGRVNRVATLGTPYLGTPKALTVLRYKAPCMVDILSYCVLNPDKVSEIGRNMPGFLELMPSPALWSIMGPIVKTEYLDGTSRTYTFDQFMAEKLGDFNLPLLNNAADWHRAHDNWSPADPNVGLMRVVGTGQYTVAGITEQEYVHCTPRVGCAQGWRNVLNDGAKDGDETVIRASAEASTRGSAGDTRYVEDKHTDMVHNDAALDYALDD